MCNVCTCREHVDFMRRIGIFDVKDIQLYILKAIQLKFNISLIINIYMSHNPHTHIYIYIYPIYRVPYYYYT